VTVQELIEELRRMPPGAFVKILVDGADDEVEAVTLFHRENIVELSAV
jgi:hypothetical protein